jgi:hypothetical protein
LLGRTSAWAVLGCRAHLRPALAELGRLGQKERREWAKLVNDFSFYFFSENIK